MTGFRRFFRKNEEPFYDCMLLKPSIFKKEDPIYFDKYRMYNFKKYLQRLEEV